MTNSLKRLLSQSEPNIPNGLLRLSLQENTGEHCLFLMVCEKYFHFPEKVGLLPDIVNTFIKQDAPLEVNLSSKTRSLLISESSNIENKNMALRSAYEEVYNLLIDKRLEKEQEEIQPLHKYIIDLENSIIHRNPNLSLKDITKLFLKNKNHMDDIDKHEMALLDLLYIVAK